MPTAGTCFKSIWTRRITVYPKKYAHGFVVLCFVVVLQSFIMNSHEVFIHIHQGCFAGTGAIVRLPQCQWSKPGGYGKISQCITTTKHSKAKTVCIFLGIYCTWYVNNTGQGPISKSVYEFISGNCIDSSCSNGSSAVLWWLQQNCDLISLCVSGDNHTIVQVLGVWVYNLKEFRCSIA